MRSEGRTGPEKNSLIPNPSFVELLTAMVMICSFKPWKKVNYQVRIILAAPPDTSQEEKFPLWEEGPGVWEAQLSQVRIFTENWTARFLFPQPQAGQPSSPEHEEHLLSITPGCVSKIFFFPAEVFSSMN